MKRIILLLSLILTTALSMAQYQIPVQQVNIKNRNGSSTKSLWRLFDLNLSTKIDINSVNEWNLMQPYYRSEVVFDSVYNITQTIYYNGNFTGETLVVRYMDSNRNIIGDTLLLTSAGKYNTWTTEPTIRNGVRFIEVRAYSNAALTEGFMELRFTGTSTGVASSIYPTPVTINPRTDLGIFGNGINTIGDRLSKRTQEGDTIMPLVSRAVRFYWTGSDFDIYSQTYDNRLFESPFFMGRYGFNHSGNLLNTLKRWNLKPMMNKSGGSIKWLDIPTANQNNIWLGGTIAQDKKYIEPTANPSIDTAWTGLAEQYYNFIALYGTNTGADVTGKTFIDGETTRGQGQMDVFEWDNEPNRWWKPEYYHTPTQYYLAMKAVYDRGKVADPNAKIFAGALPGIDTAYWDAVYYEHYIISGRNAPFPADGFNYNMYLNDARATQQTGSYGITPERYNIKNYLTLVESFFDKRFPNKAVRWTEFGYATDDASEYDVNPIGSKTDRQVAADWSERLRAIAQTTFIEAMYYYAYFEDATYPFNSMAMIKDTFNAGSVYLYSTVFPVGYTHANMIDVEEEYKWRASVVQNGDSTGVWVTVKDHLSNSGKKLYKIWRGTDNGSTSSYTLTLPTSSTSAKLFTLRYDRWQPDSTNLTISSNQVTFTASEAMSWVEVTTSGNANPVVSTSASPSSMTLPTNSTSLSSIASDPDGSIVTRAWTKVSGGAATIATPASANTSVTGLEAGAYVFRMTVTDNEAATATSDVAVTVTSSTNASPVVTAGRSRANYTNSITLEGSATDDGAIVSFLWTQQSGPVAATIVAPTSPITPVTGLTVNGEYVFRLVATDNLGATGFRDVRVLRTNKYITVKKF